MNSTLILEEFLEQIKNKYQLSSPSIQSCDNILYMINNLVPEMEKTSKMNLKKTLNELALADGDEVVIADPTLKEAITMKLKFL